ncbi:SWIM zinc finger family protein [Jeotgalibacillus proteolyticus]|uniref:SWIM-type domain-containing protein n=1 Tax=Jeotgalibacillus proteolyticus TaxID=2082395 RepID=A0A2S5G847_9BACL|nr:hypothetical protein [Jeotgalibacillus proteolyticus]PPA69125.1 hypothetical protein C4B60_17605 [Jeotgalibacillus proteolyticus]
MRIELGANNEVLYTRCDCPYDFPSICKHETACYYALLDRLEHADLLDDNQPKSDDRLALQAFLKNLSREELEGIILDIAGKDQTVEQALIVKYGTTNDRNEE